MSLRSVICSIFIVLSCCTLADGPKTVVKNTIILDGPSQSNQALFVQTLLETVYQRLGYQVEYKKLALATSFIEADNGQIDGLRARSGSVAESFKNLLKIPVPLFDFEVVMVADRRVCGACELAWVNHVAVTRGFKAFEFLIKNLENAPKVEYVTDPEEGFELLAEGKVKGAIMSDVSVPDAYYDLNHHWIKTSLSRQHDFHYLHKKHQALVPKVTAEILKMQSNGELAVLREKYATDAPDEQNPRYELGKVQAITGLWYDFTDTPDGTYRKVLKEVYKDSATQVTTEVVNWKRAKQLFNQDHADILIGAYSYEVEDGAIRSDIHIDYEHPAIAFAKDEKILAQQLAGNLPGTACYLLGYQFNVDLPATVKPYEVADIADCIRLVASDRVDMLVDYQIDLPEEFVTRHAKQEVIAGLPLFVVFKDTQRGRLLKRLFETNFRQLLISGRLESYFPTTEDFKSAYLNISGESHD